MEDLLKMKENVENVNITYNFEETFNSLYNAVDGYGKTNDNILQLFWPFYDSGEIEKIMARELEYGGLERIYYFIGDATLTNKLFVINGYGNLEDVTIGDLEQLKEDILEIINDNLEEE